MPELPEVETIRRDLISRAVGHNFAKVTVFDPNALLTHSSTEFCRKLQDKSITDIRRRGKYLLILLSNGETLILHLKMTGFLQTTRNGSNYVNSYTRASFCLTNGDEIHFCDKRRLGKIWLVENENEVIGKLGPEPLEKQFTPDLLGQLLKLRNVAIKALLCDQNLIAGIGNMYADEALFAARLHPLTKGTSLTDKQINQLHDAIVEVLKSAIGNGGASVDTYQRPGGELGFAQFFFKVAHRSGEFCLVCNSSIQRIAVRGRGTYYCPYCQQQHQSCDTPIT